MTEEELYGWVLRERFMRYLSLRFFTCGLGRVEYIVVASAVIFDALF